MEQKDYEPEVLENGSKKITIPYPQLRSLGYLRPEERTVFTNVQHDNEFCAYQLIEGDSGQGMIETWSIFPGIDLVYYDMNTEYDLPEQEDEDHILEILYCCEGRCEVRGRSHHFYYMQDEDLMLCEQYAKVGLSSFPTTRFLGMAIRINMNPATRDFTGILKNFSIHLPDIYGAVQKKGVLPLSNCDAAKHIFGELRVSHSEFRPDYLKLKLIELLLVLSDSATLSHPSNIPVLTSYQVRAVKDIRNFITEHFDEHSTVVELSSQFHFSATSLKQWFRTIYGSSIYSYLKRYRMDIARALLRRTDYSILQVALYVGYENPSKFSSAFRDEFAVTPKQYRLAGFAPTSMGMVN